MSVRPAAPAIGNASNSTWKGGLAVALTDCGMALAETGRTPRLLIWYPLSEPESKVSVLMLP